MNALTAPLARAITGRLSPGEVVVAEGSCHESRRGPFAAADGQKQHFLMVTESRVLWATDRRWVYALAFDDVTAWGAARYRTHRYTICMTHPPVERVGWVPAWSLLGLQWGNAEGVRTFIATMLGFSRRTAAAEAIERGLTTRGIARSLTLPSAEPADDPRAKKAISRQFRALED